MKKILINAALSFVMTTSAMASRADPLLESANDVQNRAAVDYLKQEGVLELFDEEQSTGVLFMFLELISMSDCENLTKCLKTSGIWDRCKEDKAGEGLYKLYALLVGEQQFDKDKAAQIVGWIKSLPVMETACFVALRDLFIQCMSADFPSILENDKIGSMYVDENVDAIGCYGWSSGPNAPWIIFYTALADYNKPNKTIIGIVERLVMFGRPLDRINALHKVFQFHGVDSPFAISLLDSLGVRGCDFKNKDIEELYSDLYIKFGGTKFSQDPRQYVRLGD